MGKTRNFSRLGNFITLDGSGNVVASAVAAATVDTDKFAVYDGNTLKFRTGTQMLSDIGALSTAGGTLTGALQINTAGSIDGETALRLRNPSGGLVPATVGIYFQGGYSTDTEGVAAIRGGRATASNDSFLSFLTNPGGTSLVERMRILNNGNVGIGTTTPGGILDIQKNLNATVNVYLRNTDNTNSSSRMYLNLVAGNTSAGFAVLAGGGSPGDFYIGGNNGGNLYFQPYLGGGVTMTLTNGSNVGIGVTNPTNRLQVSGNIYSTDTVFGRNLKPEAWAGPVAGTPSAAGIPLGYSSINISSVCDNNWRTILSNINDHKFFMWVTLGDAASKNTASYSFQMTSPAYGVSNMQQISYMTGGWNTGSFEFTYSNANGTHTLLVRCSSYYNSGATAYGTIYFLRLE